MSNEDEISRIEADLKGTKVEAPLGSYKVHKTEALDEAKKDDKPSQGDIESINKVELSIEDQARLQGWTPLEEFTAKGKDKSTWKDAKRFVEDGVLYHKHNQLLKENRQIKDAFKSLAEQQARISEMAYKQALADIEAAKRQIKQSGSPDYESYDKLNRAEADLKTNYKPPQVPKFEGDENVEAKNKVMDSMTWKKFTLLNPWSVKEDADSMFLRKKAAEYGTGMPEPANDVELEKQLTQIHNFINKEYGSIINKDKPKMAVMPVTSYRARESNNSGDEYGHLQPAEQQAIAYLKRSGQAKMIPDFVKTCKK